MAEQGTHKPLVGGSIPPPGTILRARRALRMARPSIWVRCGELDFAEEGLEFRGRVFVVLGYGQLQGGLEEGAGFGLAAGG